MLPGCDEEKWNDKKNKSHKIKIHLCEDSKSGYNSNGSANTSRSQLAASSLKHLSQVADTFFSAIHIRDIENFSAPSFSFVYIFLRRAFSYFLSRIQPAFDCS